MKRICRFTFVEGTSRELLEEAVVEAIRVVEDIHGPTRVRLGGGYYYLAENRPQCVIDVTTEVGQHVAQVFTGIVTRRFGEDAFRVKRITGNHSMPAGVSSELGGHKSEGPS